MVHGCRELCEGFPTTPSPLGPNDNKLRKDHSQERTSELTANNREQSQSITCKQHKTWKMYSNRTAAYSWSSCFLCSLWCSIFKKQAIMANVAAITRHTALPEMHWVLTLTAVIFHCFLCCNTWTFWTLSVMFNCKFRPELFQKVTSFAQ